MESLKNFENLYSRVGSTNEKRATSIRCSLSRNYLLGEKRNREGGRSLPKKEREKEEEKSSPFFLFIYFLLIRLGFETNDREGDIPDVFLS